MFQVFSPLSEGLHGIEADAGDIIIRLDLAHLSQNSVDDLIDGCTDIWMMMKRFVLVLLGRRCSPEYEFASDILPEHHLPSRLVDSLMMRTVLCRSLYKRRILL